MFPMGMVTQRMTQGRWRSKLFTSSTVWTVPADVGLIWFDGCSGGSGGGGGYDGEGGGGGGGGGPGLPYSQVPFPVVPGEVLTIQVGSAGAGGAKGSSGVRGGISAVIGSQRNFYLFNIGGGTNGTVEAAGSALGFPNGSLGAFQGGMPGGYGYPFASFDVPVNTGSNGGNPNTAGSSVQTMLPNVVGNHNLYGGGAGNATGGGGGAGGHSLFSEGAAAGGAGGSAGANATGYGGGGGGGGGNAAGGNGSPGFIRVYCFTAYDI